jgi:hypothetical protein
VHRNSPEKVTLDDIESSESVLDYIEGSEQEQLVKARMEVSGESSISSSKVSKLPNFHGIEKNGFPRFD